MNSYKSIVLALIVAGVIYLLYDKYCKENYADFSPLENNSEEVANDDDNENTETINDVNGVNDVNEVKAFEGEENLSLNNPEDAHIPLGKCGNKGSFISSNLLPKDDPQMEDGSEFAPKLDGKNFVDSYKYMIGSQSQSLRNANYQLRSDPPNPQQVVCPWSQSTIAPETRRQLEIGAGN